MYKRRKAPVKAEYTRKRITGYGAYKRLPNKPKYTKLKGYGDYKKDYGSRLGSVVGEGLQELLTQLGGLGTLTKLVGFGDYAPSGFTVNSNKIYNGGNDPPVIMNGKFNNDVVVRHREYIQDIVSGSAGAFNLQSFALNPGITSTFPWLAAIAQNFEQYRFEGVVFEFKSTSADALNSTNTALGSVIMATEYDSARPDFISKMQMENHQYSSSCRQSSSMYHPIECARAQTPLTELYVRSGTDNDENGVNDTDLRMYDWGKFQIATTGQQGSAVNLGELWVTYQIRFFKHCITDAPGIQEAFYWESDDASYSTSAYFGNLTTGKISSKNNLDITLDNTHISFPKGTLGTYLIICSWYSSSSTAITQPTITVGYNGTIGDTICPFNDYLVGPANTDTAFAMVMSTMVRCNGEDSSSNAPKFNMTGGTLVPGTGGTMKLYICSVPEGFATTTLQTVPASLSAKFIEEEKNNADDTKEELDRVIEELMKRKLELEKKRADEKAKELETPKEEKKKNFSEMSQEELLEYIMEKKKEINGKKEA